ncbi:DNA-binding transcriptional regulator, GntR family [Pseudorhodobacter antarcticus]|uniref:DNA-binding transcriptional regulator, GntR family n=1 Tax=Pseudorhodobacter antarcticus TaxID=1077947 RepID=A0A1H8L4D9_9RHOB|nr:GntR family transcriptional regulator [Pseudorhodobacter antarcticus]SEN99985.1 DNA-binding transcriptional regulator, GntR family [Pseudorhodobacter antarcticus]
MLSLVGIDGWALDQLKAVSPQLRLVLRSRIIRNDLPPMSRLSEPELAKEYGVSRQPVREAFITLMNEGLVEVRPQRGTYVKRIDYEAVLNGRFVREAVEADIVRKLAKRGDSALVKDLRSQIAQQKNVPEDAPEEFMAQDERFHQTLANAAGFCKAWDYLGGIKAQMDRVRFITFEEFPISKLIEQHEAIVDFIEQKAVPQAEAAIRAHLREILNSLPRMQELYPNYFENLRDIPNED